MGVLFTIGEQGVGVGKVKRLIFLSVVIFILSCILNYSYAGQSDISGPALVIREGKQLKKTTVAVEGYLYDGILEVKVEARMYAERPKIIDVMLVGPRLGRVHYKTREDIPVSLEEEDPYLITKVDGLISFSNRTKDKVPKGTLTKELFKIKVPVEKIQPGKRYQLWVEVESKRRGGRFPKFKFNLKKLPELISQSK